MTMQHEHQSTVHHPVVIDPCHRGLHEGGNDWDDG